MSLISNSIISYSNSESHTDLSSRQTGASLNLYKLQGLLKWFQKKKDWQQKKTQYIQSHEDTNTFKTCYKFPQLLSVYVGQLTSKTLVSAGEFK